jgi:hypothetical protein
MRSRLFDDPLPEVLPPGYRVEQPHACRPTTGTVTQVSTAEVVIGWDGGGWSVYKASYLAQAPNVLGRCSA